MPTDPVGVTDTAPAAGTVAEIDTVLRPAVDQSTPTTADPGAAGTTLALTAGFRDASGFYVRVDDEIMSVSAGGNTTSATVARGQLGTTGVAHTIGVLAYRLVKTQRVEPIDGSRIVLYKGRVSTFRIPGRAGTTGAKLMSLHNATGSPVKVRVNKVMIDVTHAAAAGVAPTVLPAVVRVYKVTVLPTNGTALTKVALDSTQSSNSAVTVLGDSSADGTLSATALTATLPAGAVVAQEFIPRTLAIGTTPATNFTELFDRETFLDSDSDFITLNALEGVVLALDYTLATQNPATDHYVCSMEWEEYRVA